MIYNKIKRTSPFVGSTWKDTVRTITTADIVLSTEHAVGGVACVAGDRVLLLGQGGVLEVPTTDAENGVWIVQTGAWTRPTDYDSLADLTNGAIYPVREGTFAGYVGTLLTSGTVVVDTTPTLWSYGSAADAQATIDLIITILSNVAWSNPAITDGTTPGMLRTTRAVDYRADGRFFSLASTDDLWDLSGETDLVGIIAGPVVDFDGISGLAAQGEIVNGI